MKKILVVMLGLILALASVAIAQDSKATAPAAKPEVYDVGSTVKNVKLADLDGNKVDLLEQISGKKAVIVFMNTACSACRSEIEVMDPMMAKMSDVDFIVISVDMGSGSASKALKKRAFYGGTWLHDLEFKVAPMFGFSYTPATVVIDKSGKVLFRKGGWDPMGVEAFKSQINDVLSQ